jgi:tRNA A-37 threonylcarbamoyl transferase component Bud32
LEPLEENDPRQVGRFEVLARLGSGGMGRVYLARTASGERFALKMIHQFLSDDVQFRRRFQREVMAARRVTGPNTAALVDADPDARPPWMAVEYVDGPTLSELIDEGAALKPASSVRLASGMAQALIDIHRAGLVHRDLKPSNVLMGADGARLIDFGIAQASGASVLTMTGLVTGSAGFMSPEQAQAEHVTEASDVFALGTVLYFAATGRRPFGEGSMISVTYRVVHADPDLSGIRDDGLRALIADCLMKDPAGRPTPREILERCPGILDGSWREARPGHTVSAFAVAGLADAGLADAGTTQPGLTPPSLTVPGLTEPGLTASGWPDPCAGATPRSGVRTGPPSPPSVRPGGPLEGQHRRPPRTWLALPVGGLVLLAAGTVVALVLTAGDPDRSPGSNGAPITQLPGIPTDGSPTSTNVADVLTGATPTALNGPTRGGAGPSKRPKQTARPNVTRSGAGSSPTATRTSARPGPTATPTDPEVTDPPDTSTPDPPESTVPGPIITTQAVPD